MKKWVGFIAAVLLVSGLSACADGADESGGSTDGDVIAPITMEVNELQGAEIDLMLGQSLNINTGDLAVDSYTGTVDDADVAEFIAGKIEASAEFNPGVTALTPGTTVVTMVGEQGGIQPLTFTVTVTKRS